MKNKYKERLTKSIIEQDIKKIYRLELRSWIFITLFFCFGNLFYWFLLDMGKTGYKDPILMILFIMLILFALGITIYTAFLIKLLFSKPFKYTIVTDICSSNPPSTSYLYFSRYGRFSFRNVKRHDEIYYTWSNLYSMSAYTVRRSTELGDEFYLILRNKKIIYIYNKKMFVLEDE